MSSISGLLNLPSVSSLTCCFLWVYPICGGSIQQLEKLAVTTVFEYRDLFDGDTYSSSMWLLTSNWSYVAVSGPLWRWRFGEQALKETFSLSVVFCSFFLILSVRCQLSVVEYKITWCCVLYSQRTVSKLWMKLYNRCTVVAPLVCCFDSLYYSLPNLIFSSGILFGELYIYQC